MYMLKNLIYFIYFNYVIINILYKKIKIIKIKREVF